MTRERISPHASLPLFVSQLVERVRRQRHVVNPEDQHWPRGSGLEPAVGVIDVDFFSAQAGGRSAQLTGAVRQTHNGGFRLLEIHAQAAQDCFGASRIIGL